MAYIGVGSVYSITAAGSGGSSAATPWIEHQTPYLRVVVSSGSTTASAAAVYIGISTAAGYAEGIVDATAVSAQNAKLVATDHGEPAIVSLGQVCSQRVIGVTTGTTTYCWLPEGLGSQFIKGQSVNLSVQGAVAYGATCRDVPVIDVLEAVARPSGMMSTRVALGTDTSSITTGIAGTSFQSLRSTFKVSALSAIPTGATVLVQQVQYTGG